jgi:hypothetical protein
MIYNLQVIEKKIEQIMDNKEDLEGHDSNLLKIIDLLNINNVYFDLNKWYFNKSRFWTALYVIDYLIFKKKFILFKKLDNKFFLKNMFEIKNLNLLRIF